MKNLQNIYMDDAVFFCDTLFEGKPYISHNARNHDSLFFVLSGTVKYEKNGKAELIKSGCVGYIAKGSVDKSSAYGCKSAEYIVVNFNIGRSTGLSEVNLPFSTVCSGGGNYKYETLFREALNKQKTRSAADRLICAGLLRQIIGMLYNEFEFGGLNHKKSCQLEKTVEYIDNNYYRPDLQIGELSENISVGEKYLRRLFNEFYGKSPRAFLREYRLNKAKILLINTAGRISDIAVQCGFSDVYSFSHCFKRIYGISPGEYRESNSYV